MSQIVLSDGRQLRGCQGTVDLPGEGESSGTMSIFTRWTLTPNDKEAYGDPSSSGSLAVNLFGLYVSSDGEVEVNKFQFDNDDDNNDLARSTWIFSEPMSEEWWQGTLSLGDGRQLYARQDGGVRGGVGAALPGEADNTDDARRIWSFPGRPKIELKEPDDAEGTNYSFSIGVFETKSSLVIKLDPKDSIHEVKQKIGCQLAKEGRGQTGPEHYHQWRLILMKPCEDSEALCYYKGNVAEPEEKSIGYWKPDPTVVHKVIPRMR